MSKHLVTGYITHTQYGLDDPHPVISFQTYKPSAEYSRNTVIVCEHSIEVEVPDGYDPRPAKVDLLREHEKVIRAEFVAKVKTIHDQINSLLAIENQPADARTVDA